MSENCIIGIGAIVWVGVALVLTWWNAGLHRDSRIAWLAPEHALSWPFVVGFGAPVLLFILLLLAVLRVFERVGRPRR